MWRDSARTPKFFFIDARSLLPLSIWLLHMTRWTFYIALAGCGFFILLQRWRITPMVCWRLFRTKLIGPVRPVSDRTMMRKRARW